jgi:hypothetical protein
VVRALARACTLTAAWSIALGVSSCSLLLDWSGYTGGGFGGPDADDETGNDANDTADTNDAAHAKDAAETSTRDAHDDVGVPVGPTIDAAPPCGPDTCGGCCNSTGFCAGGGSQATCGMGGARCQDCRSTGQSCDQGVCSSIDSGPAPVCVISQCSNHLCAPVYQGSCCLSDGTCGCQVLIPQPGTCM